LADFHGDEEIVLLFFWKKNSKMAVFQNGHFSKSPILKKNLGKFHWLVLGLVGLIDAKGIDVAQPMWDVERLSDVSAKTA
jgi:hypothetical protein